MEKYYCILNDKRHNLTILKNKQVKINQYILYNVRNYADLGNPTLNIDEIFISHENDGEYFIDQYSNKKEVHKAETSVLKNIVVDSDGTWYFMAENATWLIAGVMLSFYNPYLAKIQIFKE